MKTTLEKIHALGFDIGLIKTDPRGKEYGAYSIVCCPPFESEKIKPMRQQIRVRFESGAADGEGSYEMVFPNYENFEAWAKECTACPGCDDCIGVKVVEELNKRAVLGPCYWEYPGFINLPDVTRPGTSWGWNIGTINGNWDAQYTECNTGECDESKSFEVMRVGLGKCEPIPGSCSDFMMIADAIMAGVSKFICKPTVKDNAHAIGDMARSGMAEVAKACFHGADFPAQVIADMTGTGLTRDEAMREADKAIVAGCPISGGGAGVALPEEWAKRTPAMVEVLALLEAAVSIIENSDGADDHDEWLPAARACCESLRKLHIRIAD